MSILEINILTGYVADNLHRLRNDRLVKRVDSDNSKIVLYLDEVGISLAFNVCLHFDLKLYGKLK